MIASVRAAGFVGSTTAIPGQAAPGSDPYRLPRLRVLRGTSASVLLAQIATARNASPPPAVAGGAGARPCPFVLLGEKLRAGFALQRTRGGEKPQWLLIKRRNESAAPGSDIVAERLESVQSGITLDRAARPLSAAGARRLNAAGARMIVRP